MLGTPVSLRCARKAAEPCPWLLQCDGLWCDAVVRTETQLV